MRIVSYHYGHQDMTWYAISKLKNYESHLYNSDIPAQEEKENSFCLCLFILFKLSTDRMMLVLMNWIFFTSLLIQMSISSRNILSDIPSNNILSAVWASLSPVKLTHKINYHMYINWSFFTNCLLNTCLFILIFISQYYSISMH